MSIKDLLKPRFKVIADYPDSEYELGIIIDTSQHYLYRSGKLVGQSIKPLDFFNKYPHIFKELDWYEEREEEDMPKYLKQILPNCRPTFHKIIRWEGFMGLENEKCGCNLLLWSKQYNYIPITEEEYLTHKPVSTK